MIKVSPELKAEAFPIAIIIVFFIVFFWPAIFSDMCFVSGDSLFYSYPMREAAWNMIRGADLPLWTPHILSGYPLLSMSQLGIGYPLTWGYLFLPGYIAEEIYVLAPYILTPAFVYAYLRTIDRSRLAALLGGLSFTYSGIMVSSLGQTAMFTNAVMWLPLMLIAIERSRTGRLFLCLAGSGAAYTMCVMTGLGQGFLYVALIAVGYGAFLSLAPKAEFPVASSEYADPGKDGIIRLSRLFRLKPLIVSLGGVAIGAGLGAFQILETMFAQRLSLRREMTYEFFSVGSFSPLTAWQSFSNPIYHYNHELTGYLAPLAAVFALIAIIAATRSPEVRFRVLFWVLVAALGLILMMGAHTPIYRLVYQIPLVNLFRNPRRHAFELTFAVSALAAFGWDVAAGFLTRWQINKDPKMLWRWRNDLIGAALMAGSVVAMSLLMWRASYPVRTGVATWPIGLSETTLGRAKIAYTLLLLVTICWGWRKVRPAVRAALLAVIIVVACFWEPYLMASNWWFTLNKPASHFTQVPPPSRFLEERAPEEGRVYTSSVPWDNPDMRWHETHNLTARRGFHNAAGYEPLLTQRYGLAFGSAASDYITPRFDAPNDLRILDPRWQTLDLLNVRYLIQPGPPQGWAEKDGARFASADAYLNLSPGSSRLLTGASAVVDTLTLVTVTTNSTQLPQGAIVSRVVIHTVDGRSIEREIKAGVDTAEWAYERADVRPVIRHSLPRVFASVPGDNANSFPALRYWTKFDLGEKTEVDRVELKSVAEGVTLIVLKATIYDSSGTGAFPLIQRLPEHWRKTYDRNNVQIYENARALPRVWLVPQVEIVSAEEALRRIRGDSEKPFNPRETALLESPSDSTSDFIKNTWIDLPHGDFKTPAEARIVDYEPNRLAIEFVADKRAALVVSEVNYPGWEATIDGQPATILPADYLLRGVIVPEGKHRVEMRYTAPGARRGAVISMLTLLAIAFGAVMWKIKQ